MAERLARCTRFHGHRRGCGMRWFCLACAEAQAWRQGFKVYDKVRRVAEHDSGLVPCLISVQFPLEADPLVQIAKAKKVAQSLFSRPLGGMTAASEIKGAIWRIEPHMASRGKFAFHLHAVALVDRECLDLVKRELPKDAVLAYEQRNGLLSEEERQRMLSHTGVEVIGSWLDAQSDGNEGSPRRKADLVTVVHYIAKPPTALRFRNAWEFRETMRLADLTPGGILDFESRCLLADGRVRLGSSTGILRGAITLTRKESREGVSLDSIKECMASASDGLHNKLVDSWGVYPVIEVRACLSGAL